MTAPAGEQQQQNADAGKGDGGDSGKGGGDRTFTQAELNSLLAKERRDTEARFAGHDDFKTKAEQLDQLTAASKSELQQANDVAADLKSKYDASQADVTKLQSQLLRQQISAKEKLDPDLWDRVRGDTAEDIEADVKKLVEKFGTSSSGPKSFNHLRSGSAAPDGSTAKSRAAAALRGVREK